MAIRSLRYLIPLNNIAKPLWRYMDLSKLESLLSTSSLFFCRVDKFSDPFEGSLPKREVEFRLSSKLELCATPDGIEHVVNTDKGFASIHRKFKRKTVVNCWHINNNENDAMWRLYLKTNEGVAIQTTNVKLFETLNAIDLPLYLSRVRYLDYEKDIWYHESDYPITTYNFLVPLIHKRIEFIHENEFRVFYVNDEAEEESYWWAKSNPKGIFVRINVKNLIERIILPPTADEIVHRTVIDIIRKHGYNFPVESSKLSSEPCY